MFSPGGGPAHDVEHQKLDSRLSDAEASIISGGAAIAVLQSNLTVDTWANRPATPTDGQLFYCTDRATLYFCRLAINRWLTVELFEIPILPTGTYAMPGVITANTPYGFGSVHGIGVVGGTLKEFVFEGAEVTCSTAATYDATHYWQPNIYITSAAGATSEIFGIIARDASHTTAGQIYHFAATGVNNTIIYTTTTAATIAFIYRNNVAPSVGAGTCSVYKQSVLVRLAG